VGKNHFEARNSGTCEKGVAFKVVNSKREAKNVLEFYYLTCQLKELIRSGWNQWNVPAERRESVAEHIFGTCMLAIAINSEYEYGIDLKKTILMLVLHELEEIVISDITPFDGISQEEKAKIGHEGIKKVLSSLKHGYDYESLILEFDAHITKESQFAYMCDKLEANLMSFYYDRDKNCTLENASEQFRANKELLALSENGKNTMGKCFYLYEKILNRLDDKFLEVLEEALRQYALS